MSFNKNHTSYDVWLDYVIEKRNEIVELENELQEINHNIIDEYLVYGNENIPEHLNEQYTKVDEKLSSTKREFTYIKLLDRWLKDKSKKPRNYEWLSIYQELKKEWFSQV